MFLYFFYYKKKIRWLWKVKWSFLILASASWPGFVLLPRDNSSQKLHLSPLRLYYYHHFSPGLSFLEVPPPSSPIQRLRPFLTDRLPPPPPQSRSLPENDHGLLIGAGLRSVLLKQLKYCLLCFVEIFIPLLLLEQNLQ